MEQELTLKQKILLNKFTPLILMAANLGFFFYLIPDAVAESFDIFFAILGGVITLILSLWIVIQWLPKVFDAVPILAGLLCISTLFVFGWFFISKTTHFSTDELKENGVHTIAVVIDKTQWHSLKSVSRTTQNIDVRFLANDKRTQVSKILVGKQEFERIQIGMQLPIVYSSKHPDIAAIARR
jgi:hypothetical protein